MSAFKNFSAWPSLLGPGCRGLEPGVHSWTRVLHVQWVKKTGPGVEDTP